MTAWGVTDQGKSRAQNQDALYYEILHDQGKGLFVVCDGMGGARSGNVASQVAIEAFTGDLRQQMTPGMNQKSVRNAMMLAVESANSRVFDKAMSDMNYFGMGTTLVGAVVTNDYAVFVNVGDSRAYLIDDVGIERITRDHTVVADMLDRGELSKEEARRHPKKNLITRVIGTDRHVTPDVFGVDLQDGDFLLLCSDGLTGLVEDQELLFEILHGGDPATCCDRLAALANARGGTDNITIILIAV